MKIRFEVDIPSTIYRWYLFDIKHDHRVEELFSSVAIRAVEDHRRKIIDLYADAHESNRD